jgi:hypothetical protein
VRFSFVSVDLSNGFFCWVDGGGGYSQARRRGEGTACVNKIRSDSVICERINALAKNIRCFGKIGECSGL